jgi:cobalt-zinc-cadmium efflux system protein
MIYTFGTITSGFDSLSCHLLVKEGSESQSILREAIQKIKEQFHIQHTTIQIETVDFQHEDCRAGKTM